MTECEWMWQTVFLHWEDANRVSTDICHFLVWRKRSSTFIPFPARKTHTLDVCWSVASRTLLNCSRSSSVVLLLISPTLHFCQTAIGSRGLKVFISGPLAIHFLIPRKRQDHTEIRTSHSEKWGGGGEEGGPSIKKRRWDAELAKKVPKKSRHLILKQNKV